MASVPSSSNRDVNVTQDSAEQIHETARQAVNASPLMDEIKRAIEAKGLEPIWVRLIEEFGTRMYSQGRRSRAPSSRQTERASSRSYRDR
jgi:hypothetical protein